MSAVSEAMEGVQQALDLASMRANQLGRLLALPIDDFGRPSAFSIPHVRSLLAEAMRNAADGCEVIGVQHNDVRWTGPVALIHNASTHVWTVRRVETCQEIAALMERMRYLVTILKDRAQGSAVNVRLS
jgi:hypothetical protein